MSYDFIWTASVSVYDDLPPGMYFRIPLSVCKARGLRPRSSLSVLTLGVAWSGICTPRIYRNRLYLRIPSEISQACGFSPGQSVELRAIPEA